MLVFPFNQTYTTDYSRYSSYLQKRGLSLGTYINEKINAVDFATPSDFVLFVNIRLQSLFAFGRFVPLYICYQVDESSGYTYPNSNSFSQSGNTNTVSEFMSFTVFCYDQFGKGFFNHPNETSLIDHYLELTHCFINEENLSNGTYTFFAIEGYLISR